MRKLILPALTLGLLCAAAPSGPAMAAPVAAQPIAAPESAVQAIRHRRWHRRRAYRRSLYRRGAPRRAYAPAKAGNAKNPERPVFQQNQGGTSGGPRY